MIDESILTSNSSIWLLLRKLYGTTFNSEQGFFLSEMQWSLHGMLPGDTRRIKKGHYFQQQTDQEGWEGVVMSFGLFTEGKAFHRDLYWTAILGSFKICAALNNSFPVCSSLFYWMQ